MMALIKTLLPVGTALVGQTMPCAGMATPVLVLIRIIVMVKLTAVMALMSQTRIPYVTIAQRRGVHLVQVFLGTVENFVMAMPRVQTSGMNYSPLVDLIKAGPNQMDLVLPSAVRMMTSTSVKTDPCV